MIRGELYYANLNPYVGSEQGGTRPVLIISNNTGNEHSTTIIVALLTSKMSKAKIPTHVSISKGEGNIAQNSIIMCEQIRTIDKKRLIDYIGFLPETIQKKVNAALKISLEIQGALYSAFLIFLKNFYIIYM